MTEKIIVSFYNILSVIVHFSIILLIFSVPVLFAVTANSPPVFTVKSIELQKAAAGETERADIGGEGWYKAVYDVEAKSARFSPYRYTVQSFALKAPAQLKKSRDYYLEIDAPLDFTSSSPDAFRLTLYFKADGDKSAEETAAGAGFGTRGITRWFSFFKYEIEFSAPGFYASESA